MEALHFDAVEAIYATAEGARDWSDALGMLCANVGAGAPGWDCIARGWADRLRVGDRGRRW